MDFNVSFIKVQDHILHLTSKVYECYGAKNGVEKSEKGMWHKNGSVYWEGNVFIYWNQTEKSRGLQDKDVSSSLSIFPFLLTLFFSY